MKSSTRCLLLVAALSCIKFCLAGPLPNVTSVDIGLKEGSCALGDVVYMPGDEFPGSGPCERCTCADGGVQCAKQRCEPRPGCKALHRPDHCCPIYQCECEQEGRVYGNGEKLVDPADPCRVCYCQGGEVVCRRIACFVRDDCQPRLVPGRCCPEYDNCPLRGVTTVPGVAPPLPSLSTIEDLKPSVVSAPKENIKQEITIKEITPVSEIPVITEVKIKEILPSPSIEVAEYVSSKSPLIPREATSENPSSAISALKTDAPIIIEVHASTSPDSITNSGESLMETKGSHDSNPSKISLSTQDSINSDIYPSAPSIATVGTPTVFTPDIVITISSTKTPMIEEEDLSLLDHNPAFPPIPDDLTVPSNHDGEIISEQNLDVEHISSGQDVINVAKELSTESPTTKEQITSTTATSINSDIVPLTTDRVSEQTTESSSTKLEVVSIMDTSKTKESPMLNLRSAIPTELLNAPSLTSEDINGEIDEVDSTTINNELVTTTDSSSSTTAMVNKATTTDDSISSTIYNKPTTESANTTISQILQDPTTVSEVKSNMATEVVNPTELSSLPIETSDQNPHDVSSETANDKLELTTVNPLEVADIATKKNLNPEVITVSRGSSSGLENEAFENVETTEFIINPYSTSESATDTVELIKISAEPEKNAALIESASGSKNNVLADLINLVGDVASISDHTEQPHHVTAGISDSEELIPVNAGYKSKNKNWNVNSITEIPPKSRSSAPGGKQKLVEIEDDESDTLTDHPPPNDKVEPTTRRPIIDNVSDNKLENKTEKKDIEIIAQSYVPTISRRPTKVVMKKNMDNPSSDLLATEDTVSVESTTETGELPSEVSLPEIESVGSQEKAATEVTPEQ